MPPFTPPKVVLSGLKDKLDSLAILADRLYVGTSTGNLHIYGLNDENKKSAELVEVKKGLTRRSIEQLGFVKDVNSLVVLSEGTVTLFPLPSLSPPTPLLKAKAAFSFAVYSYVKVAHVAPPSGPFDEVDSKRSQPIPELRTRLLVGCRRKAVLYTWKDGELQDVKEASLPHSARSIVFLDQDTACFAYSPTEYAMFSMRTMTAVDIVTPLPVTGSVTAMNALTGLTGYMTLGLGAKAKPAVIKISETEVLIAKDGQGFFVGPDGRLSRPTPIDWPAPLEEMSYVKPYICSVLPPGTVQTLQPDASSNSTASYIPTSVLQIQSMLSSQVMQKLPFPFNSTTEPTVVQNALIRFMTPTNSNKSPLYFITTPTDKTVLANEGSKIWSITMRSWAEQLDELVLVGKYLDALSLLDIVDDSALPDKDQRRTRIRALNAVSDFHLSKYDQAIDAFIELDFNPAKVVALYPEAVAGRLSVPQEGWIPLYGGPASIEDDRASTHSAGSAQASHEKSAAEILDQMGSGTGSVGGKLRKAGLAMFAGTSAATAKDDDTVSISSRQKGIHGELNQSIETLVRYLSDRRPKLYAALKAIGITPESQSHLASPLSEATVEELFTLPNAPLSALTPEQLLRFAQIVDTALYKSFLIIRPILLGSLCRIPNWCEVTEVEEDLRSRKKYAELRDLYNSKKMHSKALDLLKELSINVDDIEDKLSPSIQYLQKLGPEYTETVFKGSRWIFDADRNMAFEIFTSEDVELPRKAVADHLEQIDPTLCARYLEYLIKERQEESQAFHDRLAELYLSTTVSAKKHGDTALQEETYHKLLSFVSTDEKFSLDRIYGRVSHTDLHEARAILLGRLGRHDQALETYVYRLQDFKKAEEYCKQVYKVGTETSNVFLMLLRIYLRPTVKLSVDFLQPALDLISRQSPRLDSVETLQLLPPLVTTQDIRTFLIEGLRVPVFDTQVVRQISKARNDQLARRLMSLQSRRVKVSDSRICPQCHKRLGNSVVAVHAPRGEVTHYQCREPFARRLQELLRYLSCDNALVESELWIRPTRWASQRYHYNRIFSF